MSCEHDCSRPAAFPRTLFNRPGLDRIDYRIGDYGLMRAHMLSLLDAAPALAGWTHRRPDDPGIALVEAAAMVGDVLALYQDHYANEAYLRSATWRDSVSELVRVLGYRLAPGLGGMARFALAVKGPAPVTIPAGFGITVKLPNAPKPTVFETTDELLARPALSKFHLFRPRHVPAIANGADTFQLEPGNDLALAAGDRLLVGTAQGHTLTHTQILVIDKVWEAYGVRHVKTKGRIASLLALNTGLLAGATTLLAAPTLSTLSSSVASGLVSTVSSSSSSSSASSASSPVFSLYSSFSSGSATLSLLGSAGLMSAGISFLPAYAGLLNAGLGLALLGTAPSLRAYKLGASARHFGHSAPATRISLNDATGRVTEVPVPYSRRLDVNQGDPAGPQLRPRQLPLDGELAEFSAGTAVLVELNLSGSNGGAARKRVLERQVSQIDRQSLAWGGMTGASTVLQLDEDLAISDGGVTLRWADIRGISVHQVQGDGFTLRAASQPTTAAEGLALDFYGEREDALALDGCTLLVALPQGPRAVAVQRVVASSAAGPRFHRLTLDRALPYPLFGHEQPGIDVHGNLAWASEGKTEAEAVLGDGDARQSFQTFPLPKTPLTWLLDTALTPPRLPQLQVRVGSVLWRQVESLFGHGPREQIYIVRELADGQSVVQFGDGLTGARLPSGMGNVVVVMRSGHGARGLPEGTDKPSAAKRLTGFDAVAMLEPATEGAAPESAANARLAAPAGMQSLGRIVSLADFEAEALALAGVLKARAAWQLLDSAPLVMLTLLVASGQANDAAAVQQALRRALAARGPARWPLSVRVGQRRRILIGLVLAADPALRQQDLTQAIEAALGVEDDDPADDLDLGERGLMHWRRRQFGEGLHGSQILAAVQNVPGVRWVRLERLQLAPMPLLLAPIATASTSMGLPILTPVLSPVPQLTLLPSGQRQLRASASQLLSLTRGGLMLRFVADEPESRP